MYIYLKKAINISNVFRVISNLFEKISIYLRIKIIVFIIDLLMKNIKFMSPSTISANFRKFSKMSLE